jgi:predicted Rossmann-fold nucleotide-binding protein
VFCGSNPGRRPEYVAGAAALGAALVQRGIRVVYGGAHVGTMGALADAVLAAGGEITGEFAEAVTWSQLGLHAKPTGLLNLLGYYDDLLRFLDHARAERFLRPAHRDMILAAANPVALLDDMARWRPEPGAGAKWMDADGADLHPGAAREREQR